MGLEPFHNISFLGLDKTDAEPKPPPTAKEPKAPNPPATT